MDLKNFKENLKVLEPERYAASLIGSVSDQKKLQYLYAFNYEISKAAWISKEPLICQIRLEWWKNSFSNASVINSHELIREMKGMCESFSIPIKLIGEMIDARYWDINSAAFKSKEDQDNYIDRTYGNLFWIGAQLLGADRNLESLIRNYAYGAGISSFLLAAPMLISKNKKPFIENNDKHIKNLAENALIKFKVSKNALKLQKSLFPVLLSAWQTEKMLKRVIKSPKLVCSNDLKLSELERKWSFMWKIIFEKL